MAPPSDPCGLTVLPSAPTFPGPHEETLELRMIAHHRHFAEGLDGWHPGLASDPWAVHGVHNHAIMVHGDQLLAGSKIDHDGIGSTPKVDITAYYFVKQSVPDIRNELLAWAAERTAQSPWFNRLTYTGFIILDIEHPIRPVHFRVWYGETIGEPKDNHPDSSHSQYDVDSEGDPILLDHMIEGVSRRVRAARDVFPVAKLAVFPMIYTPSDGVCTDDLERNVAAWEYACDLVEDVPLPDNNLTGADFDRQSWLDDLDYVLVHLYPRFGDCTADAPFYDDVTTMNFVSLGLEVGKRIADHESGVGVLPLLAFNIHNPERALNALDEEGSCDDEQAATVEYVSWQFAAIREYAFTGAPGYTIADQPICFWDGDGILENPREDGPQSIAEFLDALCFTPCDLNGTSHYAVDPITLEPYCVDPADDAGLWSHAVNDPNTLPLDPFHMVFDMNGDRVVITDTQLIPNDSAAYANLCGQ